MKKVKVLLLLNILVLSLLGCNAKEEGKEAETVPEDVTVESEQEAITESCVEILDAIWANYGEEKFSIGGGDEDNLTMDGAGVYSPEKTEALKNLYSIDEETAKSIISMATMQHMLNANVFTGMAIETENIDTLASTMETNLKNHPWMCGSPNVYSIIKLDDTHVLIIFGDVNIVNEFEETAIALYDATVIKSGTV